MKNQTKLLTIPKWICNIYLSQAKLAEKYYDKKPLGLFGGDKDLSNTLYASKRSKMTYIYVQTLLILLINKIVMFYLYLRTDIRFGSINNIVAPINYYSEGDFIKAHRDRDMLKGGFIEYIAVLCLKKAADGGEFWYTNNPINVSEDGKECEYTAIEHIINLNKGELFVLKNDTSIHGTLVVKKGQRITTGFRSK